ncbi:hypothetical protein BJY01DRAFT_264054 [Aspergillus pseudoustus]|uniref:NACHT domain-containing protein n=1 Tax=Aspergillus pseudoustus TaxID=1810923 RepID=A0ABR4JWG8_9EURO
MGDGIFVRVSAWQVSYPAANLGIQLPPPICCVLFAFAPRSVSISLWLAGIFPLSEIVIPDFNPTSRCLTKINLVTPGSDVIISRNTGCTLIAMAAKPARKLTAADYTVGWICALPLELAASEGMLDRIHDAGSSLSLSEGDQNSYILGEIGGHNVVMACLPTGSMGQTSATTVAVDMMHSFPRIRFGLMVGIGGGAPDPNPSVRPDEDIRLGDVVVSIPSGEMGAVIKYDRGKVVAGGEFQHTGILNVPPSVLTTAVSVLQGRHETLMNAISRSVTDMIQKKHSADSANLASLKRYQHPGAEYDQLFEADYEHVGLAGNATNLVGRPVRDGEKEDGEEEEEDENEFPCPHCDDERLVPRRPRRRKDPVIHYGPIASADMVMRHGATREKLRKKYGILCFEMEAAGLMNVFPCLVIRGICDYSDTHKNKLWQRYAAATAAAYGKELLGTIPRVKPIEPPRLDRAEDELRKEQNPKCTELLEWLGPDTHSRKWADSRKKWHRGTGALFLESQPFLNWTSNRTRTLWCRGIAGSGKTIFSSLVLDRLHAARKDSATDQKAAVICLYLEYERIQEQSLQALLAAILRQLLQQCPEPPSSVSELHATLMANQSQPPLEEICSVVADAIRTFPDVYLVVDALDESPDDAARDLLSNLRELQQSTGLKLLATSRPTIDLGEFFDEYESLEIRAPELDVKAVLDSLMIKLPKLVREDKRLQEKIKDSIAEAVDGMFILVEPFLYSLRSERTVGDINDALRGLLESPDKIAMVYERTLRRIDDHPVKDQQMAHRILAWVLLAKRPLSCREFQHALSVRIGEDFDKDYFAGNLEDAVGLCAGLVVINHESDTVQLMHHTARNYFKAAATQLDWISYAGSTITAACVTYLSFSAFSAGPCPSDEALSARLQDFPFLAYAAQQWGSHLRESDVETTAPLTRSISQAEELAVQFLREESNVWSAHQVLHMPAYGYPGYSQHFIREANGLQLAASFGLTEERRCTEQRKMAMSTSYYSSCAMRPSALTFRKRNIATPRCT